MSHVGQMYVRTHARTHTAHTRIYTVDDGIGSGGDCKIKKQLYDTGKLKHRHVEGWEENTGRTREQITQWTAKAKPSGWMETQHYGGRARCRVPPRGRTWLRVSTNAGAGILPCHSAFNGGSFCHLILVICRLCAAYIKSDVSKCV